MDFPEDRKEETGRGPDPAPRAPSRIAVPPGAVDTHAHVVGDSLIPGRSFTPPPARTADYLRMLDATGMAYGVLVQVSVHGTDNSELLRALRAHPFRLRGVAVIDPDPPDRLLAELDDAGVTGLRLNTMTGGGTGLGHLPRMEGICAEMGWHLQLFSSARDLAALAPRLSRLTVPYVLDHLGVPDIAAGPGSAEWQSVLGLARDGAWVKLSGASRLADPPYAPVIPFARALAEAVPDRCVYGSDWPHVGFWGPMPNDGDLADLLADWVPGREARDAILAGNPQRLYGFAPAGG
ncbi:MAG: amidohydrolase family protein [Streptosporangiales bacterium]|jgi:predicted TIM-barrel fold metal-dependent hydrolase|nr:amidohydrolase family protein [Streptosporangiales bacterium]